MNGREPGRNSYFALTELDEMPMIFESAEQRLLWWRRCILKREPRFKAFPSKPKSQVVDYR
jgi:hypothetical protein